MSAEEKFVGFRADPRLVEQIKQRAKSEHRSLAAHMRYLVEQDLGSSVVREDSQANGIALPVRTGSVSYPPKKIRRKQA